MSLIEPYLQIWQFQEHESFSKESFRFNRWSAKVSDNIRKRLGKLFIINNETRWNSYYNAMKRTKHFINKKRSELKALFEFDGIQYFHPAEEELVREYVKIMKPMTEALDIL